MSLTLLFASVLDSALGLGSSAFHVQEVLAAFSNLPYAHSLKTVIQSIDPVFQGTIYMEE